MSWPERDVIRYVIAALNRDVLREIRMADDCIQRARTLAEPYSRFRDYVVRCATTALSNASALAAEVHSMGGEPPSHAPSPSGARRAATMEEYFAEAQWLLAHYSRRLAMAERFGLPRLREVLQNVVASKRSHLQHAMVIAGAAERPKQLS